MKTKYIFYIIIYILIAAFLIIMQDKVWHLSPNAYFIVMIVYFISAFITRILIKRSEKKS